ncbi:MAG TPA: alanine dehydrogenase [Actinomycetota bacterium]|nr:alanine dehydrogenase [Actinomycetota bacterium]
MIVGVPTELKNHEYRVALTPAGARELASAGHQVLIERGAGAGSRIDDEAYVRAGAVLTDVDSVWADSQMILKVKEPVPAEFDRMRSGQILFTYLHLAASLAVTEALLKSGTAGVAYETVQDSAGRLPLLAPMSEVAGRMAPQVGATLLEKEHGGRGILLGGVSGVYPAKVVVLGAGMAGANAAWLAQGMEAEVIVLDRSIDRLRYIDSIHKGRILTLMSNQTTIEESVLSADLVIGAVLIPGALAPHLVSKEQIEAMKPGAVVIDISVDQGGCFETSRMTTHSDPTYVVSDVVHYCVGNMPGAVPHTSTYALTNATLPYALELANKGLKGAFAEDPALAKGLNTLDGVLVNQPVAEAHRLEYRPAAEIL